jgi:hypothetical protein
VLLWEPDNGLAAADGAAHVIGAALGWAPTRVREEIARYRALVAQLKTFEHDAPTPAQAANG